jgi:hypothetical protein
MRTRLARFGLSAVLGVAGFVLLASPAAADTNGPGAYIGDDGSPTAVAGDGAASPRSGGGGASDSDCTWTAIIEDDFAMAVYELDGTRQYSATGRWLQQVCNGAPVDVVPEGGAVDPAALAAQARESVPIAAPGINTSPDSSRRLYTQVPTWLWLDETWWQPYTATATAGRVSATVTATPSQARWSMGDGEVVPCAGPGTPWREGMAEDATDCSYTYRHSSAGRPNDSYTLTVTVEFTVTWSSSVPGAGGSLAPVERSQSIEVQVGEIQAVETR